MSFLSWLEQLPLSVWVREGNTVWAFPTILFVHTLGMSIVAGCNAYIALVLLGCWPKMPVKPLARLYPLIWAGFWINLLTGILMLMQDAVNKLTNPDFYIKMLFVALGVYVTHRTQHSVFEDPQLDQQPLTRSAKGLAWAALVCWFGAISAGRLLAYVGTSAVFGQ